MSRKSGYGFPKRTCATKAGSLRIEWRGIGTRPKENPCSRLDGVVVLDGRIFGAEARPRGILRSLVVATCGVVIFSSEAVADPRAVVELFTSQGCSSCPAA